VSFVMIGTSAMEWTEKAHNSSYIGRADNSAFIEAPRIADRPQIGSLAYKGTNYDYLLEKYDWDINIMSHILNCESGGNPEIPNYKDKHKTCIGSYGLMQLSCEHLTDYNIWDSWQDPAVNIDIAYKIWVRQGYGAWLNCYRGFYLSSI